MHVPTGAEAVRTLFRNPHERTAAAFWQHRQRALQHWLRRDSGDQHHNHFGLGDYQQLLLSDVSAEQESRLLAEMHRLESAQSAQLLSLLGEVGTAACILDAGCGRGGTSLAAYRRFGCQVDGVDIARAQVESANQLAAEQGCAERLRFHHRSMVNTEFANAQFDRIIINEASMYVDLDDAFAEFHRVLKPGGALVLISWCLNDAAVQTSAAATTIDACYVCRTHARSEYFQALAAHGLTPRIVLDLTKAALPYFELREHIGAFGSKESADAAFRTGYRKGALQYFAVVADRVPNRLRKDS